MHSEQDSPEPDDHPPGSRSRCAARNAWWGYVVCLAAIVLAGFGLRLNHISEPVVGHTEMYVPGIDLPEQASFPSPRHQLVRTILSVIHSEPHPPGFYVCMLGWTRIFGTSAMSLRLPVVLMGTGVVLLVGVIGAQLVSCRAGIIAAIMLATNPTCIAFDRVSRMYPFAAFFAVLGTVLLIESYRSVKRQRLILAGYLATMALGLSFTVFFWPVLGAHLVFSILGPRSRGSSLPPSQVRWQLWLMILASPLISIAIYQSGRPSYMSTALLEELISYLQLFYTLPAEALELPTQFTVWSGYGMVLLALSAVFVVLGIYWASMSPAEDSKCPAALVLSQRVQFCTMLFAVLVIGGFTYAQTIFENYHEDRTIVLIVSTLVPVIFFAIDWVLQRRWNRLAGMFESTLRAPLGLTWVMAACAILPVVVLGAVTAVGLPLFEARTVYVAAPFLALLVATGAMAVPGKWVGTALTLAVILGANALGMDCYTQRYAEPVDYRALVEAINQEWHEGDLLLIKNHYSVTPVFYYLDHHRMRLVFCDYDAAIRERPDCRVWVLQPQGLRLWKEIANSLGHHEQTHSVVVRGMSAHRYEPISRSEPAIKPSL